MNLVKPAAAMAAIALLAAPSVASPANPAERLSLAIQDADSGGEDDGSGDGSTAILLGVGGAAVVGAALLLGDSDNEPASD